MSGQVPHNEAGPRADAEPSPPAAHAPRETPASDSAASSVDALRVLWRMAASLLAGAPALARAVLEAPIVGLVGRSVRDIALTTSEMASGTRAALRSGEKGAIVLRDAVANGRWLARSVMHLVHAGSRSLRR